VFWLWLPFGFWIFRCFGLPLLSSVYFLHFNCLASCFILKSLPLCVFCCIDFLCHTWSSVDDCLTCRSFCNLVLSIHSPGFPLFSARPLYVVVFLLLSVAFPLSASLLFPVLSVSKFIMKVCEIHLLQLSCIWDRFLPLMTGFSKMETYSSFKPAIISILGSWIIKKCKNKGWCYTMVNMLLSTTYLSCCWD